jgi:hypothetical protein
MSKFKVGDKVRITNTGSVPQELISRSVGKIQTVTEADDDWGFFLTEQYQGGIWDANAELVVEKSLEDQLADAEKIVAELKQKIEDAKPKAAKLTPGTIVSRVEDSTMVKLGTDSWATVDTHIAKYPARNANIVVYRDEDIDRYGFEVIREGI